MSARPQQMIPSPSVARLREEFRHKRVSASDIVTALLRTHNYTSRPDTTPGIYGESLLVDEWIERASTIFDAPPDTVLHGRLLIIALALLDKNLGRALTIGGVLREIVAGVGDPPPLRPQFQERWAKLMGDTPAAPPPPPPSPSVSTGSNVGVPPRATSTTPDSALEAAPLSKATPPPSPRAPPTLADDERVATHADDPALVDQLGRRPFARVVADRIREVWATPAGEGRGSLMVHVHGPWGSGKTSILNFLAGDLCEHARATDAAEPLVVEFNAWRHQRLRPPWWTLIREIYDTSVSNLGFVARQRLRIRWRWWRAKLDLIPVLAAVLVLVAGVLATWYVATGSDTDVSAQVTLGLLGSALTVGGTIFALSRTLVFGSARAAQTYADLRNDPMDPIVRLFEKLVAAVGRPLVVFIDDLDRCDAAYVVELLEGIQTLFRSAPVTYVVAADRKWICSSFEARYESFGATIGEPGRPLGYLFLDKMFQISAPVPQPAPGLQRGYWEALLRGRDGAAGLDEQVRAREQAALRELAHVHTQQELERHIARVRDAADPAAELAMRAAAARRITSPEAQQAVEHRLRDFAALLEPNPRAMKRLVNAFGLHQATHLLEGRSVPAEALARWTIVELRWPLLADHLAARPQAVSLVGGGEDATHFPAQLRPLLEDELVRRVIRGDGEEPGVLDERAIREIVGRTG